MIRACVYGRLGADPVERKVRNDKLMCTVSVAVSVGRPDLGEQTLWVSLAAFGRAAEALARHAKGDLLAVMGPLHLNRYTARDGTERQGWSLTVDALMSARTVRPGGSRRRTESAKPAPAGTPADDGAPFDDPIPWGEP